MSLLRPALVTTAVLAAALTAACSSTDSPSAAGPAAAAEAPEGSPSSPPARSGSSNTPTDEADDATSPIDGIWRAGPRPFTAVVESLEKRELGRWAEAVLQGQPDDASFVFDLKLSNGDMLLSSSVDDEPQGIQDRQAFTVDGRTVEFAPYGAGCTTTLQWEIKGEILRFVPQRDTCPDYLGTPDIAYMVALYASAPFVRVAS